MKSRKLTPELMDDPSLDEVTLKAALKDVTLVNKWLGGQQITIDGLNYFFRKFPQDSYKIVDLGCGDGEMLRTIASYARKQNIKVELLGLDLNEKSINLAKEKSKDYPEISFKKQDILTLDRTSFQCDIVVSVLTMHHFTNEEILVFMQQFLALSKLGVVINDLQRSKIAHTLFKGFSKVFMKTHIARHDGLISIERAFKKNELLMFTNKLPVSSFQLKWRWAFRYLWILEKQK
ncbi:MAG: methyltransferase domain-containing protein [Leeuwenhoekiella sp.]|nr:methyltransferase domain-containing protein [Leeuwenhoekiella sp.]